MPTTRRTLVGLHLFNGLSAVGGAIMVGWILGETLLVEGFSWLQGLYLLAGSIVVFASIRLSQATPPASEPQTVFAARDDQQVVR